MPDPTCLRWHDLLLSTHNRGQIYNDFLIDKNLLTQHLINCLGCIGLITAISPQIQSDLTSSPMTDEEFSKAIRELWKLARQKGKIP